MAEAIEIANAYVALTTKMPGIKGDIESALGGSEATGAAEKSGRSLGSKLVKGIGATAVVGTAAVAAAGVATIGVAIAKGFSRLDAIDVAEKKLTGLGNSAEDVEQIMSNASASVKGTAFGLGDAAGVAAQIVAAGIKPGEQLEGVLKSISNNAAAAGADLGEMGSIFAKAATQANGVQNDVLSQIADRGIPIYQALGDQMGVTAGEVFKLASEGKVSFEMFQEAATAAAGTVADEMGGTVGGALANLNASLGRSGANLLAGIFDELAPTIQAMTSAMGPLEDVAGDLGERIGEFLVPAFEWFRELLDGGFDFSPFMDLLQYLSPLGVAFQVLQPVLPLIAEALGQIASTIGGALGEVLVAVLPFVGLLVQSLAQFVAEVLPPLLPMLTMLAELFAQLLVALMPILEPLMQLVTPLLDLVMTILPPLISLLAFLIEAGILGLQAALAFALPMLEGVANMLNSVLSPAVEMLQGYLAGLIDFLTGVFSGDWEKAWQGVSDMFGSVWSGIEGMARGAINGIIDLINGMLAGISGVGGFLSDITGGAVSFSVGQIPHLANGGVVTGSSSGTLALIGEAGRGRDEAVIPLPPDWRENGFGGGAGGNVQIDVHPAQGMDEYTLGVIAGREASRAARGF